ncbi:MAG: sensor domain-containing diguanylate cyclase [Oscillospiraceae bacterium]|nr:sensor domain-containing diguanylate cyclase [Oscillospiraceae bacterium]
MGEPKELDFLKFQKDKLDALLAGKAPAQLSAVISADRNGGGGSGGVSGGGGEGSSRSGGEGNSSVGVVGGAVNADVNCCGDAAISGCNDVDTGGCGDAAITDSLVDECFAKFNTLISQMGEIRTFMLSLCHGNLDATVPGRRNYLAAPLKELHTQLSSLTWSMEQLAKGHVVSRLYYQGALFESFNSLIDKVASVSNQLETPQNKDNSWEWSVNSWRYHQILSALNNLHIMVLEVAQDGKIVYANRPAREYFGGIEYLARAPKGISSMPTILEDYLAQVSFEGEIGGFPKFREIFDETNNCWYKITSDRVHFSDSHAGYLHMIDNISEWKKHESSLKQTATTDPLTGVYNRGFGLQALEEALYEAKEGTPCCAAFIDMDDLKIINDAHGHTSGDYAIRTVAETLVSSVRDNKDVVCRFGGDEFIVIFKNCTESSAQRAIVRMRNKLSEINEINRMGYDIEFSYGIIQIDGARDNDLQSVIEEMDQIMYKNKAAKKQAVKISKEMEMSRRESITP